MVEVVEEGSGRVVDNKIVVASVKEHENNIALQVWREDDQKIVGLMATVGEGRQHNHGGVVE